MRRKKIDLNDVTFKSLECSQCGTLCKVPSDIKEVLCWKCTQKLIPMDSPMNSTNKIENKPKEKKQRKTKFVVLKEFIEKHNLDIKKDKDKIIRFMIKEGKYGKTEREVEKTFRRFVKLHF